MKNKANIKRIGNRVVVYSAKGEEIFNMPRSEQTIGIGHAIYMYEKYSSKHLKG